MMNRTSNLRRLAETEFDLCIIGGGASGAGCALDASLRGLKVALIEKTDFAAETSGKSTKLVHGGVRYLEQAFKKLDFAQLRQVRHGLNERHIVLKNAPHLARPIGLITPVFSFWEGLYFSLGLKLYDWFAGKNGGLPKSRWLGKKEALQLMPGLNPTIHSAVLYYDGQLDDARYCLALVQSAAEQDAVVANHLKVIGFQKGANGKINAAVVLDQLGGTNTPFKIKAKQFLNCTGPFADQIRLAANSELSPRIRPSKGVHLVLPAAILGSDMAMLIPKTRDGRMVFAIPFEGKLLLGTTDEAYTALNQEPVLEAAEINYLLETLQPFVANTIQKTQVIAGFGGVRPLIQASESSATQNLKGQTKSLLRDHEVELDPDSGLISLLGGKWTTYRLMASDAIDQVYQAFLSKKHAIPISTSADYALVGAFGFSTNFWEKLHFTSRLDEEICRHLAANYGSRAEAVIELITQNPALSERILPDYPYIKAEIVYAVRVEMALTVRDFLARRIRLEILNWEAAKQAIPIVAHWMGKELQWTDEKKRSNVAEYLLLIESFLKSAHLE